MHGAVSGRHPRTVRHSAPLEIKILIFRVEVLKTMLYECVTWSPRACHNDKLGRAHHIFLVRCIGWRTNNRTDHPISYLDTLRKTGSESIEAIMRRKRLCSRNCDAHGEYETTEVRDVRRTRGGPGLRGGGKGKNGWEISWTT